MECIELGLLRKDGVLKVGGAGNTAVVEWNLKLQLPYNVGGIVTWDSGIE